MGGARPLLCGKLPISRVVSAVRFEFNPVAGMASDETSHLEPRAAAATVGANTGRRAKAWARPEYLVVAAAIVVFAWLASRSLGAKSFWIDEILSRTYAKHPLGSLFSFFAHGELNMALYHVTLHFWLRLGDTETDIRGLSVIFGIAALAYALSARLISPRAGALATVLLALNGAFYSFAREARSYSLTITLVIAASFFFVRALEEERNRDWIAYVVTATLAVYAHLFSFSVLLAHLVSLQFWRERPINRRRAGVAGAVLVALLVPAGIYVITADKSLTTDTTTRLRDVIDLFRWYASGNRALVLVYVLGALAATIALVRKSLRTGRLAWPEAFLISWVAVPIATALVVSYMVDPIFEFRYLLVALPAFILLIADGIALAAPVAVFVVLAIGASAVSARSLDLCRPGCATTTQDFRSVATYISSRKKSGDDVRFDPSYLGFAYEYYARHHAGTTRAKNLQRAWLLVDEGDPNSLRYHGASRLLGPGWRFVAAKRFNLLVVDLYVRHR
jgi:hypothetical protein